MSLRVVIVDDHAIFRRSARKLLQRDGFDVVGEAEDGAGGLELARRLVPDVVLLDVALPDMSGFDVAEFVEAATKVVLVSSRDEADFGARARSSKAIGFIPKDRLTTAAIRELLDAA
jgi:two-component system response regulator EvgA